MSTPLPSAAMLAEMAECAYRLGMVFGAEAERAETHERRMEAYHLFDRCFFAVRVSIALQLRLKRTPLALAPAAGQAQAQAQAREWPERERGDPSETEREEAADRDEPDRDRDREPVSVPSFLNTLRDVAAGASARPGPAPAALTTLRGLLDQVPGGPLAKSPSPPARTSATALRSRLAGSGATAVLAPAKLALPTGPRGDLGGAPLRRATGPPPRR